MLGTHFLCQPSPALPLPSGLLNRLSLLSTSRPLYHISIINPVGHIKMSLHKDVFSPTASPAMSPAGPLSPRPFRLRLDTGMGKPLRAQSPEVEHFVYAEPLTTPRSRLAAHIRLGLQMLICSCIFVFIVAVFMWCAWELVMPKPRKS